MHRVPIHAWIYRCGAPQISTPITFTARRLTAPLAKASIWSDSTGLDSTDILRIQQVVGTLLYYTRAIDVTLRVVLNSLGAEESKGSENTAKAIVQVLNYCATHPDATL
jgi:hypothetical protein